MHLILQLLIFVSIYLGACMTGALACDPNQDCSRCVAPNPFGGCIQKLDDPGCLVQREACRRGAVPKIIPDPPAPPPPPSIPEAVKCVQNPAACTQQQLYDQIRPIVVDYINRMETQANGRWRRLDEYLIESIQPFYQNIDLHNVVFATNINTEHGQNMTVGYHIFFTQEIDFNNVSARHLVFHELRHVVQYAQVGGVDPFMRAYLTQGAGAILQYRTFDVHNLLPLEQDAESYAIEVSRAVDNVNFFQVR